MLRERDGTWRGHDAPTIGLPRVSQSEPRKEESWTKSNNKRKKTKKVQDSKLKRLNLAELRVWSLSPPSQPQLKDIVSSA